MCSEGYCLRGRQKFGALVVSPSNGGLVDVRGPSEADIFLGTQWLATAEVTAPIYGAVGRKTKHLEAPASCGLRAAGCGREFSLSLLGSQGIFFYVKVDWMLVCLFLRVPLFVGVKKKHMFRGYR